MSKLNNINNFSISNLNAIIKLKSDNERILKKINNYNINNYNSKNIHVIESDWVNFTLVKYADGSGNIQNQYIAFETIFEKFPENLIPYISSNIIFNQIDDVTTSPSIEETGFYLHEEDGLYFFNSLNDGGVGIKWGDYNNISGTTLFQIEDIANSNLKRVSVVSNARSVNSLDVYLDNKYYPQFEGKLVLTIYNPNDFYRIN